jgi:hypothetical protein
MINPTEEFVVPYETKDRGSMMVGELRSETATLPSMLAQFSRIHPYTRKAEIHLYPTLDQVKELYELRSPFSFTAEYRVNDEIKETWKAQGIWLKSGSRIGVDSPVFWSAPFGEVDSLEVVSTSTGDLFKSTTPNAWFAVNQCFLFQLLANPDQEDIENAERYGFARKEPFFLPVSDGANAEVTRRPRAQRTKGLTEITKDGYSVIIREYKDVETARQDAEALMILASLASRERTMFWHWNSSSGQGDLKRIWRFNTKKFPRRIDHHEPLLPRNTDAAQRFMATAFPLYRAALHRQHFDSAVYALMANELVLELRVARLFAGIQGALVFALQEPQGKKRPQMRALFDKFIAKFGNHFADLWPLLKESNRGSSLSDLRNAVVHGDTFGEEDFIALSFAVENLSWILERILLLALGWDIDDSDVSSLGLTKFYGYQWRTEQAKLKL